MFLVDMELHRLNPLDSNVLQGILFLHVKFRQLGLGVMHLNSIHILHNTSNNFFNPLSHKFQAGKAYTIPIKSVA